MRPSILDHFSRKFVCLLAYHLVFPTKLGYLTRSNLEIGILIIPDCCKKMIYQYVVVAKMN
jgi:hypothetical protein